MMPFTGASKWLGTAKMGVVYSTSYPPYITRFLGEISFSVRLKSLRYLIMHSEKKCQAQKTKNNSLTITTLQSSQHNYFTKHTQQRVFNVEAIFCRNY